MWGVCTVLYEPFACNFLSLIGFYIYKPIPDGTVPIYILIWIQYSFLFHLSHIEPELIFIFLSDDVCLSLVTQTNHISASFFVSWLSHCATPTSPLFTTSSADPGSGIQCYFDPRIWDGKNPDPGKTSWIIYPRIEKKFFGLAILNFVADPGSGAWGSGIRWWAIFAWPDPDPQTQPNLDPGHCQIGWNFQKSSQQCCDPEPYPQGPYVFGPPGSGSETISTRYHGSGSFYNQAKIVRKP